MSNHPFPQVTLQADDTIDFGTGFQYKFRDKRLLEEACTVMFSHPGVRPSQLPKGNQILALVGDAQARAIIVDRFRESDRPVVVYNDIYNYGMAKNSYLAMIAEDTGLLDNLMMCNGVACWMYPEWLTEHEKASAVEAIFGAVWEDRAGATDQKSTLERVMAEMHVFWPTNLQQEARVRRAMRSLRQARRI